MEAGIPDNQETRLSNPEATPCQVVNMDGARISIYDQ